MQPPGLKALLSVAGYDPSSGAGVLLDIAVFGRLGFLGTGILTAVTAQNPAEVREFRCLPAAFLFSQFRTLVDQVPLSGIKVGMLGCRKNIPALGRILSESQRLPIVVDPVFRSSSGKWLLEKEAIPFYIKQLRGRTTVLTPNLDEAALLSGRKVRNLEEMKDAAKKISDLVAAPCLLKGGHLEKKVIDLLYDGKTFRTFENEKIKKKVHGTGCFHSSSLLCFLVKGYPLPIASGLASDFTRMAVARATPLGKSRTCVFRLS